ncbi:MAG: bifunctional methylenetetrahydrofolate dehydrogenase/methenyltetrahydrofolate cyclohydrolase FolD [Clostridia bacterium]|nr:bifunctional methylenetetrahydrofolate dehydrogenase/methenyltetrahydrofolate cyclohydrolase FolD [Clostridia bacterium]
MCKIIDGKRHSAEIRDELRTFADSFEKKCGRRVGLAVILIGDDPASQVYVRNKEKACEEVGIKSFMYTLGKEVSQEDAEELVRTVCEDDAIDGVIVQLPLPGHLDRKKICSLIPVEKDVDGFSAENMGLLALNDGGAVSACTPLGIMKLLEREGIDVSGKNAVVVGRSAIVGRPMSLLLLNADATVTVCHSKTKDLEKVCAGADILVAAVGRPKFITAAMVKEGAVVIDVGMDRDENGKLCGDVDFESVKGKCSYITPVPGGVGPMTVTMLMYNTCRSAARRNDVRL